MTWVNSILFPSCRLERSFFVYCTTPCQKIPLLSCAATRLCARGRKAGPWEPRWFDSCRGRRLGDRIGSGQASYQQVVNELRAKYAKKDWLCSQSMMSTPRCNPCTARAAILDRLLWRWWVTRWSTAFSAMILIENNCTYKAKRNILTCQSAVENHLSLGKIDKVKKKPVSFLTLHKEYGIVVKHKINYSSSA